MRISFLASSLVAASAKAPHLVYILVDDMGFNDIGLNNDLFAQATPTIVEMAGEGVQLDSFYTSATCTP